MIRISWLLVSHLAAAIVILAGPDQPEQVIDTERSFLTVHVGKTGVLSAAAQEHWVNAPIAGGTIAADGSTTPAVRFTVDARGLSVRPEKGVTDKDRAEVQANMQSKVLESNMYPDIVFRSTEVRRTVALVWRVSGDLTLHRSPGRSASTSNGKTTPMLARFASSRRSLAFSRSRSAVLSG
jgi:hypothetical protein